MHIICIGHEWRDHPSKCFLSLRCCREADSGCHVEPILSENPQFEKLPHRFKLASPGTGRSTFKERREWTNSRCASLCFSFFEHDIDFCCKETCYELCQPRKTNGCGCVHSQITWCQSNNLSLSGDFLEPPKIKVG